MMKIMIRRNLGIIQEIENHIKTLDEEDQQLWLRYLINDSVSTERYSRYLERMEG